MKSSKTPEAPQHAAAGEAAVFSRADIHVTVSHKEGVLPGGSQAVHQLMKERGVGLGRQAGQRPLNHRENSRVIVLHHRAGHHVRLVGQYRDGHTSLPQSLGHLGHTGVAIIRS